MEFLTIFFIALSLAMDAFAVSVTNGITAVGFNRFDAMKQGIYFGIFQFAMPVLGWILGSSVKDSIESVDHWIAFILLGTIGGNMIYESFHKPREICTCSKNTCMTAKCLILQAIATSIDALAIGISFALLEVNILFSAIIIGLVAFSLSFFGGILGKSLGGFFQKKAQFAGGIILIGIGLKILTEHLFF